MLSRARLLILANLLGSLAFTACGGPEASHLGPGAGGSGGPGAAGSSGVGGAGNASGAAGDTSGLAGSGTPDASATGLAGDMGTGVAGTSGAAGVGAAGAGVAGAGAAGAGAAGAGVAGAGAAGAGAAGAGAAGKGAAGAGVAGAGAAGAGAAGAGAAGAGAAGAGAAGAGAAGAGVAGAGAAGATVGEYTNYCSPVHWAFSANPTAVNAMDFPSNVADGTLNDRWSTGANQAPGQYIQIDFGGTVSLTQVAIDNTNQAMDYPRGYDVSLSANGTTFTSVATGTPAAMSLIQTATFAAATARYLRVTQTGTANVYWSVDELHIACTVPGNNAGLVDPYDPTYWKATASESSAAYLPALAIDPDVTTRWSTGADQAGGEVFTLDLSGPASVSQIWLDAGALQDFPAMYKLELSTNGTTYTQVATGAGAQLTKITFPTQMARYFRITQTATATVWWSIYNITVKP